KIVVIQADNPDADSLGSALALEHILGDLGKDVQLYCGVDIPGYLRYLSGWDRVQKDLPSQFDLSIIVDASTMTLLAKLEESGQLGWVKSKPCVVLDHHAIVENKIEFAAATICDERVSSTGELIFNLAERLNWPISPDAGRYVMTAILGDTQGLTNDLAAADTYRVMAALVEKGVHRPALEDLRREYSKMPPEIYKYKAALIDRTEFAADGLIAHVTIPQSEINEFSPLYNPAPLIQNDMLQTQGVGLTIVFKSYDDGKVTAAIRANAPYNVAGQLAEHMGGGGHPYASGFKIVSGKPVSEVKSDCINRATELMREIEDRK
ncbi:MAG TPA: DHH family phosphoesterase, partial [Candidatus Saccharimonadales bacterium]|nr:DHH family phosphoesterase [Candidatus Saccharimonadales bacterium]